MLYDARHYIIINRYQRNQKTKMFRMFPAVFVISLLHFVVGMRYTKVKKLIFSNDRLKHILTGLSLLNPHTPYQKSH